MRLTKHLDENSIQLGPGGRPGFTGWGRGSSGGGKTSSQEGERPSTPANRFSALGSASTASDSSRTSGRGQTPSRDSKSRTTTPRPQSKYGARASQEQDRESALSAVRLVFQIKVQSLFRKSFKSSDVNIMSFFYWISLFLDFSNDKYLSSYILVYYCKN